MERGEHQRIELSQGRRSARRLGGRVLLPPESRSGTYFSPGADHPEARGRARAGRAGGGRGVTPSRCTRARRSSRRTCGFPAIHCYLEGDPEPIARGAGPSAGRGRGQRPPDVPVRPGRLPRPDRQGRRAGRVACPSSTRISTTTSAGGVSRRPISGARPWATERLARRARPEGGEPRDGEEEGGQEGAKKKSVKKAAKRRQEIRPASRRPGDHANCRRKEVTSSWQKKKATKKKKKK